MSSDTHGSRRPFYLFAIFHCIRPLWLNVLANFFPGFFLRLSSRSHSATARAAVLLAMLCCHSALAAPPDTPVLSLAAASNTGAFFISWAAVADTDSYELDERFNGGSWSTVYTGSGRLTARTDLRDGSYDYRLRACNSSGCSQNSNIATVVVQRPASVPTLSAPASSASGAFTISWSTSATATSYRLEQRANGAAWALLFEGNATSYDVSGLVSATYDFRVKACNTGGCGAGSVVATTVVLLPPPTPQLTLPASSSTGTFGLSWTAAATATSYQVDQSANYGPYTTIFSGDALGTNLFGLETGFYQYVVRACNASGCSADSAAQGISVLLPPATPLKPIMAASATGTFLIAWNRVTGATRYQLDERQNGGGWTTVFNANNILTSRPGLAPGIYEYQLRACNDSGCSANSPIATIHLNVVPALVGPLSGPSTNNSGSYTLTWGAANGANSYTLQERLNGGGWSTIFTGSATEYTVSNRGSGTYDYQAQACNATGCSQNGNVATVVVLWIPTVPTLSAPASSASGAFTVSWSASATATNYQLEQRVNGGAWALLFEGNATGYDMSGLASATYDFRVKACNTDGCSADSVGTVGIHSTTTVATLPF